MALRNIKNITNIINKNLSNIKNIKGIVNTNILLAKQRALNNPIKYKKELFFIPTFGLAGSWIIDDDPLLGFGIGTICGTFWQITAPYTIVVGLTYLMYMGIGKLDD